jgi:hypothetical protein
LTVSSATHLRSSCKVVPSSSPCSLENFSFNCSINVMVFGPDCRSGLKSFRGVVVVEGERLGISSSLPAGLGGLVFVGVSKGESNTVVSFHLLGESSNDEAETGRKGRASGELVKGARSALGPGLFEEESVCEEDSPIQLCVLKTSGSKLLVGFTVAKCLARC